MEETCIKNMGVYHSFDKMKPQLCFFFKKPSLVNIDNDRIICINKRH